VSKRCSRQRGERAAESICARGIGGGDDRARIDAPRVCCAGGCSSCARGTRRRCARSCVSRGCWPRPRLRCSPVAGADPRSSVGAGAEAAAACRKAARRRKAVGAGAGAASCACSRPRKPRRLLPRPGPRRRSLCETETCQSFVEEVPNRARYSGAAPPSLFFPSFYYPLFIMGGVRVDTRKISSPNRGIGR
jgi:hypothetical protein